jgi:ABC-2 type transport system ATP-binding protein
LYTNFMKETVITYDQVFKTYKADIRIKKKALTGLHFQVQKGEVFGVVGPNGAGKSTALKILMGFVRADKGNIDLNGQSPTNPASHKFVGFLPENPCLYEHLTIIDHLKFCARVNGYSSQESVQKIQNLIDLVDLSHSATIPIRRFSKGMTQRAALACALFHEPEILILDEPMSGLDPLGRQLVIEIIREYNKKGHTILFCSHILTDVERMCDRIGIMCNGKLASIIKPEELAQNVYSQTTNGEKKTPLESFFLKTVEEQSL